MFDRHGRIASPGARSSCPGCGGELLAKCGGIVSWHWSHRVADCDPWSEPESEWHLGWKRYYLDQRDASVEVVMPPHRADVVLPDGRIIELQSSYLDVDQIARRERFYGPGLIWLYRCHWSERIHYGRRGFWWKHGSKSMATHRQPVWWDMGGEMLRVTLGVTGGGRVLGRVVTRRPTPQERIQTTTKEISA